MILKSKKKTLLLKAPAKINLILRVISKRDDGYHELETWMQKISLFDSITVEILDLPGIYLTCKGRDVPADESNLLWRAADLFLRRSRNARNKGISINLQKNQPG